MTELIHTTSKHCFKCRWCARWDNFDPLTNKRWHTYSCTLEPNSPFTKGIAPTLDKNCPHFAEPYRDEEDEKDM